MGIVVGPDMGGWVLLLVQYGWMGIVVGTGMGIVDGYSHPAPIPYPIYGFTALLPFAVSFNVPMID